MIKKNKIIFNVQVRVTLKKRQTVEHAYVENRGQSLQCNMSGQGTWFYIIKFL